jgi:hypothetical protein
MPHTVTLIRSASRSSVAEYAYAATAPAGSGGPMGPACVRRRIGGRPRVATAFLTDKNLTLCHRSNAHLITIDVDFADGGPAEVFPGVG